MAEPVLSCKGLTFRYRSEDAPVFSNLSLTVSRGEAVLLMGPSGCGKSTLAYCLAGLYPEYGGEMEGEILLKGKPLSQFGPAARSQAVSILFQNPDNQFCMDRVDHEILFALENINYSGDLRARTRELLTMVGLEQVETAPIYTLSGGTKQKLALATALATGADTLILDEPFANLDPGACGKLSALLEQLNRQGITLLIVDHRPNWWRGFLSRIVLMEQEGVEVSALGQRTLYATNWVTAAQLSSRVLAYGGLGLLFAFTTNSMDLVMSLMQQFRLPPKFAYGILAAYHFFPVVREEYRIVGAALRVRGVKAGPFSTRRLFPMLAHALERSESLAMAMESRGFESRQPRAVAFRVPLRAVDFLFLIGLNSALAAALFFL